MADITKNATALKMIYVIEVKDEKEITKSKTISDINPEVTDEQLREFANAILKLQQKTAHIARVDSQDLGK